MRLLVLGGTEFVGRAMVDEALRRGWETAVFNRGTRPAPPGVTALRGDRTADGGLAALRTGEWDLVVDTWSLRPDAVRDTARLLSGRARHYSYVSSRSVYAFPMAAGLTEDGPLVDGDPDAGPTDYARDKRGGELAVEREFGQACSLLARAGLVLGPWENVGRLPWWLSRIARGGPVLAPGPRDLPLQYVDARDLARWTLDAGADGRSGPFDLVSASGHTTMGQLLEVCADVTGSSAELRWADPGLIAAAGIEPWSQLPGWTPPGPLHDALHRSDTSKALAAGLRPRPVAETVADTWAWVRTLDGVLPPHARAGGRLGVPQEKEAAALALLDGRDGGAVIGP